jgi:hypothetical protein
MSNDPRRPRRPQKGSGDPVSDIERFLKEVDRLRRKASDETQRSDQQVDEVVPVEPVQRRRPEPRPVAKPKRRPRLEDEPVPVLEVEPVERPRVRADPVDFTPPPPAPAAPPPPPLPEPSFTGIAAKTPAAQPARRAVPTFQVRSLLQAGNLRTAMILREVLDKPLCKLPHRLR